MPGQHTRNISFTPEHDQLIEEQVRSGRFQSASEVVRAGLRLLEVHERTYEDSLREVQSKIAQGLAQADVGQLVDGPDAMARARQRIRNKAGKKKRA